MKNLKLFSQVLVLMTGLLFFVGCQQDEITPADLDERTTTTTAYPNVNVYGLGTANELYLYRSGPPATYVSTTMITGLRDGEQMLAIDFNPLNGKLYGVSSMDMIYTINLSSSFGSAPAGSVTKVSQTPFTPSLEGTTVAMDINPRTGQIHLITDKGQNLRLSSSTGQVVAVDIALSSGSSTTAINSAAFSNNYSGTYGTTLYDVDMLGGNLYRQAASGGSLTLVGSTGLTISGEGGLDISRNGSAFAVYNAQGPRPTFSSTPTSYDDTSEMAYRLYGISLRNGAATSLVKTLPMIGIAVQ
jgi:hypothetical protein